MPQYCFDFKETIAEEFTPQIQRLIDAAHSGAQNAYAPYSGFKVGAAVLMIDGNIKVGCNHENASYPAGICAERSLLSAINPTDHSQQILAIAVSYISNNTPDIPLAPCGICRQTLLEQQLTQGTPIAIYMCSPGGKVIYVADASLLLPFYFSNKNLEK